MKKKFIRIFESDIDLSDICCNCGELFVKGHTEKKCIANMKRDFKDMGLL